MLRCGMIGANIGRSRFPTAFALMAERAGVELDYVAIDTEADPSFDFGATVDRLAAEGRTGVTVTHPYKAAAAAWAGKDADPEVVRLGACNTLLFAPRRGGNTDYTGFLSCWPGDLAPGRVAVAGAGGVARAVVPALRRLGAEVAVWDADPARAEALAAFGATPATDAAAACAGADGLVNCTPLGQAPDTRSAFDPAWIGPQRWAFDAVYTPTDTPFLTACAAKGLRVISGFDLFRHMVVDSFALYTGIRDGGVMDLLEELRP